MFRVCISYAKDKNLAKDFLQDGFIKVFRNIKQYQFRGSFEGWMKRIVINQSLMHIRKNSNLNLHVELEKAYSVKTDAGIIENINYKEIIDLIKELPMGYRTVFNLYVVEGYKHKEIAEILDISINTSKSQLILAKKKLRALYKKKHEQKIS